MYAINSLPYILFFLFSLLLFAYQKSFSTFSSSVCKSIDFTAFYYCFLSVIVFLGCRGLIAADWLIYEPHFENVPTLKMGFLKISKWLSHNLYASEPGYAFFVVLCKSLINNYLGFQLINVVIDMILLHIFFKRYCPKYYFLCWAFYWIFLGYVFEIITLRNTKSILIFAVSLRYIYERKPLKYFLLIFVALLFHSSSIFYFPLYFLNRLKRNKSFEIIIFIFGLFIFIFHIAWLQKILFLTLDLFPGHYGALLKNYLSSTKFSSSYGISIGFLERLFTFFLFFHCSDKIIKKEPNLSLFWYLYLIYLSVYLFCSEFYILVERIPNLFVCSYWILYAKIYENIKRKSWRYVFILVLIVYGILKTLILLDEKWAYYENFLIYASDVQTRAKYYTY